MRRWAASAAIVLLCGTVGFYYADASIGIRAVKRQGGDDMLFAAEGTANPNANVGTSVAAANFALSNAPLDQSLLNSAMVAAQESGKPFDPAPWVAALRKLGWRHTPSLQNMLGYSLLTEDVGLTVDVIDALLRRAQLWEQATSVMFAIESQPDLRHYAVGRLMQSPPWEHDYLLEAGNLTDAAAIDGHYQTLHDLQTARHPLDRQALAPFLPVLVKQGEPGRAFLLWKTFDPKVGSPLNDGDFRVAAQRAKTDEMSVPFEWQFGSGNGFYADVFSENGTGMLNLRWDGRGVPVFAQQRTSALEGDYDLVVRTGSVADLLPWIGFRLVCPKQTVQFKPVGKTDHEVRYQTEQRLACRLPVFEVYGLLQDLPAAHDFTLNNIRLSRRP